MRDIRHGFSLLELLAVVVILGIIAAILVPRVSTSSTTARTNTSNHILQALDSAIEQYYMETGTFPSALTDLVPTYLPGGVPACPEVGHSFTINASTHRAALTP